MCQKSSFDPFSSGELKQVAQIQKNNIVSVSICPNAFSNTTTYHVPKFMKIGDHLLLDFYFFYINDSN